MKRDGVSGECVNSETQKFVDIFRDLDDDQKVDALRGVGIALKGETVFFPDELPIQEGDRDIGNLIYLIADMYE